MNTIEHHLLGSLNDYLGFARKRLRDPELAADAVQESMLKALEAREQIHDVEKTKAWFYRILRRTIIDLYRRQDARSRALENFEREPNVGPSEEEDRAICACMEKLIAALTPQYAVLIRRLDLNEEDPQTVAASLGINNNNLKVRAYRARQQLRRRLEETCRMCAKHGCLDCRCAT